MNNRKTPFIRYGKGNGLLETLLVRGGYLQSRTREQSLAQKAKAFFRKLFS